MRERLSARLLLVLSETVNPEKLQLAVLENLPLSGCALSIVKAVHESSWHLVWLSIVPRDIAMKPGRLGSGRSGGGSAVRPGAARGTAARASSPPLRRPRPAPPARENQTATSSRRSPHVQRGDKRPPSSTLSYPQYPN